MNKTTRHLLVMVAALTLFGCNRGDGGGNQAQSTPPAKTQTTPVPGQQEQTTQNNQNKQDQETAKGEAPPVVIPAPSDQQKSAEQRAEEAKKTIEENLPKTGQAQNESRGIYIPGLGRVDAKGWMDRMLGRPEGTQTAPVQLTGNVPTKQTVENLLKPRDEVSTLFSDMVTESSLPMVELYTAELINEIFNEEDLVGSKVAQVQLDVRDLAENGIYTPTVAHRVRFLESGLRSQAGQARWDQMVKDGVFVVGTAALLGAVVGTHAVEKGWTSLSQRAVPKLRDEIGGAVSSARSALSETYGAAKGVAQRAGRAVRRGARATTDEQAAARTAAAREEAMRRGEPFEDMATTHPSVTQEDIIQPGQAGTASEEARDITEESQRLQSKAEKPKKSSKVKPATTAEEVEQERAAAEKALNESQDMSAEQVSAEQKALDEAAAADQELRMTAEEAAAEETAAEEAAARTAVQATEKAPSRFSRFMSRIRLSNPDRALRNLKAIDVLSEQELGALSDLSRISPRETVGLTFHPTNLRGFRYAIADSKGGEHLYDTRAIVLRMTRWNRGIPRPVYLESEAISRAEAEQIAQKLDDAAVTKKNWFFTQVTADGRQIPTRISFGAFKRGLQSAGASLHPLFAGFSAPEAGATFLVSGGLMTYAYSRGYGRGQNAANVDNRLWLENLVPQNAKVQQAENVSK